MRAPPVTIRGAQVWDGERAVRRDLHMAEGRIVEQAASGVLVVDLEGHTIFPGLVNAHDHLELNHYPRTKFREVYDNAHQWGEDVDQRLDEEPFKSLRAYPLWDRLFIGGLKNLLCGATTVAHHGPKYRQMYRHDFPVRVLKNYGWAHSLHFNTEAEVIESYRRTPKDWPWFIHLAEGTDDVAAGEYRRLKALGCVGPNTVIVHGVGMTADDIADAASTVRGLVWCPTTNQYLLEQTAKWDLWGNKVSIGSDSRLTADGDWLDEARGVSIQTWAQRAASLRLSNVADWWVWGGFAARGQVRLVVRDGTPRIGDPDIMAKFPHVQTVPATLDDRPKAIHTQLARQIHRCTLKEPGLEVAPLPGKRFFLL